MTHRILFVGHDAGYFLLHRLPVAIAARAAGYEVHVAAPGSPDRAEIERLGFAFHPIRLWRTGKNPLQDLITVYDLYKLNKRLRPDIVHQVTIKPVLYGTAAARLAGVPAILNAITGLGHVFIDNSLPSRILRVMIGAMYKLTLRYRNMRVVFENSDDAKMFVDRHWTLPQQTVVAWGGTDTQRFSPTEPVDRDPPVVLIVTRMIVTKGVMELVDAARILRDEGVRTRFVFVGEPDERNPGSVPLASLQQWHAEGLIEYRGACLPSDVPAVMREADIFCLPSWREGLPRVLLEASAAGLPIVTTDTSGCRDVIAYGETGFLVPLRDAKGLASALKRLIEDRDLRLKMGAAGRKRAVQLFSDEIANETMLAVYRALV